MFARYPTRVGVISDIHAHLTDLDRALQLLCELGADRIVCLGDALEKGPDPDAVVERLHEWLIPTVAGNHDLNALALAREEPLGLSPQTVEIVSGWPLTRAYTWGGSRLLLAHATPYDTGTAITPESVDRELKRRLRSLEVDVLLLGHAHRPFATHFRDILIANPGSVRGGAARDSHTAGLLHLPGRGQAARFDVIDLDRGEVRRLL